MYTVLHFLTHSTFGLSLHFLGLHTSLYGIHWQTFLGKLKQFPPPTELLNDTKVGYDEVGYDELGCDEVGYDEVGYDELGYDELGYVELGYDELG